MASQLVHFKVLPTGSLMKRAFLTADTGILSDGGLRVCLGSGVIKVASRRSQDGSRSPEVPGAVGIAGAEPQSIVQRHAVWKIDLPILMKYKWERG